MRYRPSRTMRWRVWALAVAAALLMAAGCIGDAASAVPLAQQSPSAVLAQALADLQAGHSVHIGITATSASQGILTYSDEATAAGGWRVITTGSGGRVSIVLIAGVGYVAGNAAGLLALMQLPGAQAHAEAGQWISVRPGQHVGGRTYADITGGITLSSVASELAITGPLTLTAPTTVAGQQAIGIEGRAPASLRLPATTRATLYVATSDARPLLYQVPGGNGTTDQMTFTDWDWTITLTVPPHPVPATALRSPDII